MVQQRPNKATIAFLSSSAVSCRKIVALDDGILTVVCDLTDYAGDTVLDLQSGVRMLC